MYREILKTKCQHTIAVLLICLPVPSAAVLTIEVTKGVATGVPIAVVPFAWENAGKNGTAPPHGVADVSAVIASDLARSGRFELVPRGDFLSQPHELPAVKYKDWRLLKTEALVIGKITKVSADNYEVRFRLLDVFREQQRVGQKFTVPQAQLRKAAHQISDIIYHRLIGRPGAFDTRIAYVVAEGAPPGKRFLLQVADADGQHPKTILESPQPIISPTWSPDGRQLAYVSFEKNRSIIYVQELRSGERKRVAEYPGINSAPAWSPDGSKLAFTLSKDGNPEIYIYAIASGDLRRVTRHTALDTEPAWAPSGDTLLFTSNRSGTPQIYQIASRGGTAQRLTFNGKYNVGAHYSSDGKLIALITNQGNGYRVGVYSTKDRIVRELTKTTQDESPSFAPNDGMILYATQSAGRDVLAAVSPDGRVQQSLQLKKHSVREPAWSPFNRKLP